MLPIEARPHMTDQNLLVLLADQSELDPVLAVQDALEEFAADEIVVVGAERNGAMESALRRFGLPVTRLDVSAAEHQGPSPPTWSARLPECADEIPLAHLRA